MTITNEMIETLAKDVDIEFSYIEGCFAYNKYDEPVFSPLIDFRDTMLLLAKYHLSVVNVFGHLFVGLDNVENPLISVRIGEDEAVSYCEAIILGAHKIASGKRK